MSKKAIVSSETLGFVLDDLSKSLGTHPGSVLIEGFESTTGITNSTNVTGLSVDIDHKGPGSYSIEFDKTGGTEAFAYVNNTLSSLDISRFAMDGSIIWFIYLSALTDIAHVRLFLGNSYDNCAYWQTADSSLSAGWNMLVHDLKSPTSFVGNGLNLSNITFIRAYIGFDAVGNTLNDIRVDSVMVLPTESIVGSGGLATEATLSAIKTAVEVMDDWDAADRAKVNVNLNAGVAVDIGAGNAGVGTARVIVASDDIITSRIKGMSTTTDATEVVPIQGIKTVAAIATPEALAVNGTFFRSITIIAKKAARTVNTAVVYLGIGSTNDTQPLDLYPGDIITITAPGGTKYDLNDFYLDVTVAGEGVMFIYS